MTMHIDQRGASCTVDCPECDGIGTVFVPDKDSESGAKVIKWGAEVTKCPRCKGTGKITYYTLTSGLLLIVTSEV